MSPEQLEVWSVVRSWNTHFAENRPEKYFPYLHDDITLFIASSPYRIDGLEDDREEFEWSLKAGRTRVAWFQEMQPDVQIHGDAAVVTYHTRGAYGPEGTEQIIYLKETNVLAKVNGAWRIVHIHVSK